MARNYLLSVGSKLLARRLGWLQLGLGPGLMVIWAFISLVFAEVKGLTTRSRLPVD